MPSSDLDVIVVGGGPSGINCGIEAARNGFSCRIFDKGCLVNSLFHYPTNMVFFSTSRPLEIGDVPFISHGVKPTRREALEYYRRVVEAWNLEVNTYEAVEKIEPGNGRFTVKTSRGEYRASYIIIATGFYDQPNMMNIPGEELTKVLHYFTEPHPYAYQKILVIGGGNSAVDVALETYRREAEVTMVIREAALKEGIKYWVKPDIENRIREGAIRAYFNSEVLKIGDEDVLIKTPEGELSVKNDFVFAMTGYHPDYSFLTSLGIEITRDAEKTPIFNPDTFETSREGVFLSGMICGGMVTNKWTLENSPIHAAKIFKHLQKLRDRQAEG